MRVIGFEAANSYVKIKSEERDEAYPNVLWRVTEDFQGNIMGGNNKDESKVYTIGEDRFRPGVRGVKGYRSSSGTSEYRYRQPQYKNESIIALARHCSDGDSLSVVTAVPAIHYNNKDVQKDIESVLKNVHSIRENDQTKIFTVKKVQTLLQPAAMLVSAAFNADGGIREAAVAAKTRKLVVDIGWGTTDVAIMYGLDLIDFFPVEVAMFNAYSRIEKLLKKEYPDLNSQPFKLFDLEQDLRNLDTFIWAGKEYDCKAIKERAFRDTANEIVAEITNRVQLSEFSMTLFGGGGIEALKDYLRGPLDGYNARRVQNAQMANAIGCYIYGKFKK